MKPFEKFLSHSSLVREILDTYLELRTHLQEEGYSQKELERVKTPTLRMLLLYEKFNEQKRTLFKQIRDYGFEIHMADLIEYIQPLLNKIDEITPLRDDGNNERNNIGNDDY